MRSLHLQIGHLPVILADRTRVELLSEISPIIYQAFLDSGLKRAVSKESLQYCGLLRCEGQSVVFVPMMGLIGDTSHRLECASLTMRVLAKYGREHKEEIGDEVSDRDGAQSVSLVKFLADDFVQHGLFVDRVRSESRNGGKIDWAKTLARKLPYITENEVLVFQDVKQTSNTNRTERNLSRIQASVLSEIANQHGWWLERLSKQRVFLARAPRPRVPRELWVSQLHVELRTLYSQRSIDLARALIDYLTNQKSQKSGNQVFGVENFHSVWELMLRKVLEGGDQEVLKKLPKPVYRNNSGKGDETRERGMQPDIVVRQESCVHVVDAKYYDARTRYTAPGWSDIVKQLVYEQALRTILPDQAEVKSWFIFPWRKNGGGPLSRVEMVKANDGVEGFFPEILCGYLSVIDVMQAYLSNSKILLKDAL